VSDIRLPGEGAHHVALERAAPDWLRARKADKIGADTLTGQPEYLDTRRTRRRKAGSLPASLAEHPYARAHWRFVPPRKEVQRLSPMHRKRFMMTYKAIAAAIKKPASRIREKIVDAFADLTIPTPVGPITYRAADNKSTILCSLATYQEGWQGR